MYLQSRTELLPIILGLLIGFLIHNFLKNAPINEIIQKESLSFSAHKTPAQELYNKVKIACLVLTQPQTHETQARHVLKTWGKRCNKLIFFSTKYARRYDALGVVELPVTSQRGQLWNKFKEALKYAYKNHLKDFDWFYMCNDLTYAILENMRHMVYSLSPTYPIAFGFKLHEKDVVYFEYSTGVLMSKGALIQLVEEQILGSNSSCESKDFEFADVKLGHCLKEAGVVLGNDEDSQGRRRFLPMGGQNFTFMESNQQNDSWIWEQMFYKPKKGLDCCSNRAVAIGSVRRASLYEMEYYLYHLKLFGRSDPLDLPQKMSAQEIDAKYNITEVPVKLTDANGILIKDRLQ